MRCPYHDDIEAIEKPVIAMINGICAGGGVEMSVACDFRIASSGAVFGQPQVRFGAPAAYELMRAVMGAGAAREMCLTGRRYDAAEALAIGLVNRVVEPAELVGVARGLAHEVATLPDGVAETAKQGFRAQQPRLFES